MSRLPQISALAPNAIQVRRWGSPSSGMRHEVLSFTTSVSTSPSGGSAQAVSMTAPAVAAPSLNRCRLCINSVSTNSSY
ncbi:Uncharacterised protein [Mycobacteroides abscessus subsp. abscessus]|nr:Uncharacterised protein [Mycobacteroides abscessus subsp. abscessus]